MKYLATFVLLVFVASVVKAQKPITIETPDFLFYDRIKNSIQNILVPYSIKDPSTLQSFVGAGGENMTWDFTSVSYTPEPQEGIDSSVTYPSIEALLNDSSFNSSNDVVMHTIKNKPLTFTCLIIAGDGIYDLGSAQDSSGVVTKVMEYNPPLHEDEVPIK